jgi:hypothetical protein
MLLHLWCYPVGHRFQSLLLVVGCSIHLNSLCSPTQRGSAQAELVKNQAVMLSLDLFIKMVILPILVGQWVNLFCISTPMMFSVPSGLKDTWDTSQFDSRSLLKQCCSSTLSPIAPLFLDSVHGLGMRQLQRKQQVFCQEGWSRTKGRRERPRTHLILLEEDLSLKPPGKYIAKMTKFIETCTYIAPMKSNSLHVISWNVKGNLSLKMNELDIVNLIHANNVVVFHETWMRIGEEDTLPLPVGSS